MSLDETYAPGWPGIPPTWTSSDKDFVTTSLGSGRVWATTGHGICNEVYWPSTGEPQIRDLGFVLARSGLWIELKRLARYSLSTAAPGVPLSKAVHTGPDYELALEVMPDPDRDVLLISYELKGDYALFLLLAPHLRGSGVGNTAWVEPEVLYARKDHRCLALVSQGPFRQASAGFVGVSDGWQDFARDGRMTSTYRRAEAGNVALTAELAAATGTLALGFSSTPQGARTLARSSLAEGYAPLRRKFISAWQDWTDNLVPELCCAGADHEAVLSAQVLKIHQDKTFRGAVVASLSVPWGNSRDDLGGYHLVWTRDAVEAGLGFLAVGAEADACTMLAYLIATQCDDGCWSQNYYPDGRAYWQGIQLDEVALPILLAAKVADAGADHDIQGLATMVRRAAAFLCQTGPVSAQDRWEENAGINPFTLGVMIAALVAAARWLTPDEAKYVLSLADFWNERIEDWTYAPGGAYAERFNVDGYYLRVAPPAVDGGLRGRVPVTHGAGGTVPASALVGLEFLYLVRLGLRHWKDRRIVNTVKVVDGLLRVETPSGPAYHRYNRDGYGEHQDGRPFDGSGIGRAWPLLTGERGHYALAAGDDPALYLATMRSMTGPGALLPEQVWDTDPIPERGLFPGRPTGSAMPLVWAHAEYVKLAAACRRGRPMEQLDDVVRRYACERPEAGTWHWRLSAPFRVVPAGRTVLIEMPEPFVLHMGSGGWRDVEDRPSHVGPIGLHEVRLEQEWLAGKPSIDFTFFYPGEGRWQGEDYRIEIESPS